MCSLYGFKQNIWREIIKMTEKEFNEEEIMYQDVMNDIVYEENKLIEEYINR